MKGRNFAAQVTSQRAAEETRIASPNTKPSMAYPPIPASLERT